MKYYLIINPLSKIYKQNKTKIIEEIFIKKKINYQIILSEYSGHITILSKNIAEKEKNNKTTIIVAGGDGSVNEAAKSIVNTGINLGIIPTGTANVIAKELNIPKNIKKAFGIILKQKKKKILLSKCNDFHFIFTCGIGFDGMIVHNTDLNLKKKIGKLAYFLSGLGILPNVHFLNKFQIEIDNKIFEAESIIINRTERYAGNFKLFKKADIFKDKFEILIFKKLSLQILINFWQRFALNKVRNTSNHFFIKGKKIKIKTKNRIFTQIDGESVDFIPKTIEVTNDYVNFLIP